MRGSIRGRLTYANVMATIAVFIALGGSSYAAITLKKNSVRSKHIAPNAVNSKKVKDRTLQARDFKPGQIPAGAPGAQGPQGPAGAQGPAGSPDTPAQVLEKLQEVDGSDSALDADLLDGQSAAAFLPAAGKAADADLLDGQSSNAFLGANAKAADADSLDGINSTGFLTGGPGMQLANRLTFDPADPALVADPRPVLLNIPFLGQLRVDGCDGTNGRVNFNTNGSGAVYVFDNHTGLTAPVTTITNNHVGPTIPKGNYTLSVARNTGTSTRMATIWIAFNGDDCTFQAQALLSGSTG
jgi:hypothetical protein